MREWTGTDAAQEALGATHACLFGQLSTRHLSLSLTIVAIARIHRRTVDVYSFLSDGLTYRAMGKVVACRTIFLSNLLL